MAENDTAIWALLSQHVDPGHESAIVHANKRLLKRMQQKSTTIRELSAIFTLCRQHYLLYRKLKVGADHMALTWLEYIKNVDRVDVLQNSLNISASWSRDWELDLNPT